LEKNPGRFDVGLVNVGDGSDKQQLVVYPGVVTFDASGQGASERPTLVAQSGVLGNAEYAGKQLVASINRHCVAQQVPDRAIGCLRRISNGLTRMTEKTLTGDRH
jgi:hypothetical protein